jgi:hypothetical protein
MRVIISIDSIKIFQFSYTFLNNHQLSMYPFLKSIDYSKHSLKFLLFPLHFIQFFNLFFINLIG